MANLPNSVPSFGVKSNGQTIDASHINAVQDELVAAGGWVNGTAPITSSNTGVSAGLVMTGVISPAALSTGDTTDYNPSGLGACFAVRLSGPAGGSTLVSLTTVTGAVRALINVSANTIGLKHNSGTAGNRFAFRSQSDTNIGANGSVLFWYDPVTLFWREIG